MITWLNQFSSYPNICIDGVPLNQKLWSNAKNMWLNKFVVVEIFVLME